MNGSRQGWVATMTMVALGWMVTPAAAGSLDAPAAPDNPASATFTLNDLYHKLDTRSNVVLRTGGFAEPSGGPTGGTMHTLNEIMSLVTNRAPVPETGQTNTYRQGDCGWHALNGIGVAKPVPRFTILSGPPDERTHCVLDNLTGLMWARDASNACGFATGLTDWNGAIDACNNLVYGGYDDWRLPNARELYSLVDGRFGKPCFCNTAGTHPWTEGDPFFGVWWWSTKEYWSSTTHKRNSNEKWALRANDGMLRPLGGTSSFPVWPVRGGGN